MSKPSRTINKLHFEDLDPGRFETLCLTLVHRLKGTHWKELYHHGASGSDDGVDIYGLELIDSESGVVERKWFVQVKRYQKLTESQLINIIDEALNKNDIVPNYFLLIASCNPSKKAVEAYKKHGEVLGIDHVDIWGASELEARLYNEAQDLLFAYFGVSLATNRSQKAESVRRNLQLKKRMLQDFKETYINDPHEISLKPYLKYGFNNVLIRSIDDTKYPEVDCKPYGISSWFKCGFYDFYHNGIELWVGASFGYKALINNHNEWDILGPLEENPDPDNLDEVPIKLLGRVPFEAIIDYDLDGDEYEMRPHIYCDFKYSGEPYSEFRHVLNIPNKYPSTLQPDDRIEILR